MRPVRIRRLARNATVSQETPPRRAVTYLAFSGIGNRLQAHLMAAEVARRTGRALAVWWPRNPHFSSLFPELFDHGSTRLPRLGRPYLLDYDQTTDHPTTERWEEIEEDLIVLGTRWQYIWFDNLKRRLGEHREQALATLRPHPEVLEQADALSADWDDRVIGVHVRLGDLVTLGTEFCVPVSRYLERMRALEQERGRCRFYLASDGSEAEIRPILDEFGDRLEWRLPSSRATGRGGHDALVDQLLLARTCLILRNGKSSFSLVPRLMSGAEEICV